MVVLASGPGRRGLSRAPGKAIHRAGEGTRLGGKDQSCVATSICAVCKCVARSWIRGLSIISDMETTLRAKK